jgi:hypothetical protein
MMEWNPEARRAIDHTRPVRNPYYTPISSGGNVDEKPQGPVATPEVERRPSEGEDIFREIPRDAWGVMQRVHGVKHILLWPNQFCMLDMFKFITAWGVILSLMASIVKLLW